jgi:hypothetical protein
LEAVEVLEAAMAEAEAQAVEAQELLMEEVPTQAVQVHQDKVILVVTDLLPELQIPLVQAAEAELVAAVNQLVVIPDEAVTADQEPLHQLQVLL